VRKSEGQPFWNLINKGRRSAAAIDAHRTAPYDGRVLPLVCSRLSRRRGRSGSEPRESRIASNSRRYRDIRFSRTSDPRVAVAVAVDDVDDNDDNDEDETDEVGKRARYELR